MKLPLRFGMSTTRADFRRLLPAAVNYAPFVEDVAAFIYREGKRSWRIGFTPLPLLQLGLIRLERHQLDFAFTGYSEKEIEAFMTRFEMYFRRGGG